MERWFRQYSSRLFPLYESVPYPFKAVLTSARGYPLYRARYQKRFWTTLRDLLSREDYSPEEMRNFQNEELRKVVTHAYRTTPFYRECFSQRRITPSDIREAADLEKLPVLRRETVRENWQQLISSSTPRRKRIQVFTSGTSGSGLPVVYDEGALTENWAFKVRQKAWVGIHPRDWRITLFGNRVAPLDRDRPPFWTYNLLEKQILMSIFHLSESHKGAYLEYLRNHSHLVLEGFPTVLHILADFILDNGSLFPMKGIFTDGEPLYPFVREKVEKAFGTKIFEHYGMTEWAGLIQECEQGGYHQISDYGILEILDEKDHPVEPGTEGYLVWTGFTNPTMPFLRYRVGDKGMMKKGLSCPCGKPFPLVSPTITREGDYLLSPDGRILSPRAVNQVLKNKTAFKSCQFIQEDLETIVIRIVRGNGKARAQGLEVQRDLISMVGGSTRVHVEEADAPLQYGNGKIPLIVSKIKGKQGRWLGSEKGFDTAVG